MEELTLDSVVLLALLKGILGLVAFRSFPFVAYICATDSVTGRSKLVSVFCYTCLLLAISRMGSLDNYVLWAPVLLAYFALVATAVFALYRYTPAAKANKTIVFAFCSLVFIILPVLLLRFQRMHLVAIVGTDMTLATYSYWIDNLKHRNEKSLRDCLFFILVDPTMVYTERGKRVDRPRLCLRGLLRTMLGIVAVVFSKTLVFFLETSEWKASKQAYQIDSLVRYFDLLPVYSIYFASMYFGHSGLASIQIGIMRMLGFNLPERYHYPFLSKNPADFWRRWNTWIGAWARRYLFTPFTIKIQRSSIRLPYMFSVALSIMVTFVVIGIIHDYVILSIRLHNSSSFEIPFGGTLLFIVFGLVFVVWHGVAASVSSLSVLNQKRSTISTGFRSVLSWGLFMTCVLVAMHIQQGLHFNL